MTEGLKKPWKTEDQAKNEDFFVYKLQNLAVNLPTDKEKFDSVVAWPARGIVREEHEPPFSIPPGAKINDLDVTIRRKM